MSRPQLLPTPHLASMDAGPCLRSDNTLCRPGQFLLQAAVVTPAPGGGTLTAQVAVAFSLPPVLFQELLGPDFSPFPPNTAPWQADVSQMPGVP